MKRQVYYFLIFKGCPKVGNPNIGILERISSFQILEFCWSSTLIGWHIEKTSSKIQGMKLTLDVHNIELSKLSHVVEISSTGNTKLSTRSHAYPLGSHTLLPITMEWLLLERHFQSMKLGLDWLRQIECT